MGDPGAASLTLIEPRCGGCGRKLAEAVSVRAGWVELACDRCGRRAGLGQAPEPVTVQVRCPTPWRRRPCRRLWAVVSAAADGWLAVRCDRCKERVQLPFVPQAAKELSHV